MRLNNEARGFLRKNDLKAAHFVLTRLILFVGLLIIIFSPKAPILLKGLAVTIYFISYSFLGMAGISHELLHNTLFRKRFWNIFFFRIFGIMTLTNYAFFEFTHWKHHKEPLSESDPKDLFDGKLSKFTIFLWVTFDFFSFANRFKVLCLNSLGIIPNERIRNQILNDQDSRKILNKIILGSRIIILCHLFIAFIALLFKMPIIIVFTTFGPFVLTFFNKILAISQHYGLEENENLFYSCRTVILPSWLAYLYGNMNYHTEHHLFPGVPAYNLPKAHNYILNSENVRHENLSIGIFGLFRELKAKGLF